MPTHGRSSTAEGRRTGRPSRTDDYRDSDFASRARAEGLTAAVAVPVIVQGAIWGTLAAGSASGPLPASAEGQLTHFADLIATAIASVLHPLLTGAAATTPFAVWRNAWPDGKPVP